MFYLHILRRKVCRKTRCRVSTGIPIYLIRILIKSILIVKNEDFETSSDNRLSLVLTFWILGQGNNLDKKLKNKLIQS